MEHKDNPPTRNLHNLPAYGASPKADEPELAGFRHKLDSGASLAFLPARNVAFRVTLTVPLPVPQPNPTFISPGQFLRHEEPMTEKEVLELATALAGLVGRRLVKA